MSRSTPTTGTTVHHLNRSWRRRCVSLIAASGGGIVLLNLLSTVPSWLRYGTSLLLSGGIVICAWLLSDTLKLWRDERLLSADERALRDRSVVRAYLILGWLCIALAVGLHLPGFVDAEAAAEVHGRTLTLMWAFLAATVTLPGLTAAWSESWPEQLSVDPARLVRQRLRGADAPAHAATLVLMLVAIALLALLVMPPGQRATLRIWAVAVASLALLIAGLLVTRPLLREVRTEPPADS